MTEIQSYEVEIKALLGSPERAAEVLEHIKALVPNVRHTSHNVQLNYYFVGKSLNELLEATRAHLSADGIKKLADVARRATSYSIRARKRNDDIILVVKASENSEASVNGIARIEFEETVALTLEELDALILRAGFTHEAKWSRERDEYEAGTITVCMDKNAGYGYVAEFERLVHSDAEAGAARAEIEAFMAQIGVRELPQDRLDRMFSYYNTHWPEYYGTDKIFDIQ